ncbi:MULTISPECIES: CBS domain-containing protein [unclassified Bacillus (in: firmicutes)]|uniref:CBS domain-containing protein n=1 Tax=unclassified Bacillus (in: firmicutes) TaxID=185979 RepID=UPI0008E707B2|nr:MULTISPECIES: CBS domain-containing protein [unclassified Bacillus (in: firmicutes)]SFA80516.1 CBS domain-containing protein [Bacillus sp. UNCCL13]SFQ70602.1 CBS domain-containing protein [Bacillus sp. cl95]
MNIAFFLIPKNEVAYIKYESTMRQALEKMEYHRYSAVPLIDCEGRYIGTLTEGDLLWKVKNTPNFTFESTNKIWLRDIPLHKKNKAISINSEMEDIILKSLEQNFVPVVDDNKTFIGIIRRREIIEYCAKSLFVM